MSIAAVIVSPQAPASDTHGEQLELLSPSQVLEAALKPFLLFPLSPIVVVLGHDYHRILNLIKEVPPQVKIVIHRKPERGLVSALSVGLSALDVELKAIVIAKGDQIIEPRVLDRLLQTFENEEKKPDSKKRMVVPFYHGKRGFPWVVSSELRKPLARLEGEFTLDGFLRSNRKEVLKVEV